MTSMIGVFNKNVSDEVNKGGDFYKAYIGQTSFTPNSPITKSSDFNCGALSNELEYCRGYLNYITSAVDPTNSKGGELDQAINALVDLPRRGDTESDAIFLARFNFIVQQNTNYSRTTRWAILDALSYFVSKSSVEIVEPFGAHNLYFQVRFIGVDTSTSALFLDNTSQGFLDNNFLGGAGIGSVVAFIGELISRIRAAGVEVETLYITQGRILMNSNCQIGSRQIYFTSSARISGTASITMLSNATID